MLISVSYIYDIQLSMLRVKLEQVRDENRNLRSMLDQATKNYTALHGHLLSVMQKPAHVNHSLPVILVSHPLINHPNYI